MTACNTECYLQIHMELSKVWPWVKNVLESQFLWQQRLPYTCALTTALCQLKRKFPSHLRTAPISITSLPRIVYVSGLYCSAGCLTIFHLLFQGVCLVRRYLNTHRCDSFLRDADCSSPRCRHKSDLLWSLSYSCHMPVSLPSDNERYSRATVKLYGIFGRL